MDIGGGGGGGGGGGDSSAACCWSINHAREIGLHGLRTGRTKDARRQHFCPLADSNTLPCDTYICFD